jgi:hypothetical protein
MERIRVTKEAMKRILVVVVSQHQNGPLTTTNSMTNIILKKIKTSTQYYLKSILNFI